MRNEISADGLASLLEHTARLIHANGYAAGLNPAQWAALRYFAVAPPRTRTMARLARFQGLSNSPVIRTVKALVDKGYLERVPNPGSRRSDLFLVTAAGKRLLATQDPKIVTTRILADMTNERREHLADCLRDLVDQMIAHNRKDYLYAEITALDQDHDAAVDPCPNPSPGA